MVDKNPDLERLEDYRLSIDNLDSALIAILAERVRLTDKIGKTKAAARLAPMDPERESRQHDQFRKLAEYHHLDVEVALEIMTLIIEIAKARHEALQGD